MAFNIDVIVPALEHALVTRQLADVGTTLDGTVDGAQDTVGGVTDPLLP